MVWFSKAQGAGWLGHAGLLPQVLGTSHISKKHRTFLGAAELQGFAASPSESSGSRVLAEKKMEPMLGLGWKCGVERAKRR